MRRTVEMPLGETSGSIRAVSIFAVFIRQLAFALSINDNDTKRRKSRGGDMIGAAEGSERAKE